MLLHVIMADKKQDGSSRARKSFIQPPKIYSKTVTATSTTEKVEVKDKKFVPGDRVSISGVKKGIVLYFGKLHVSDGLWCGIELDDPEGLNDGQIDSVRYFSCKPLHGIFAPIEKVERATIPGKTYTTWAKVSNIPEKKVEQDKHGDKELQKSSLKVTCDTLEEGILEEQPPFQLSSALPKNVKHYFEFQQQQQPQQYQQQQQPHPQSQQQQYPQPQYFQYPQPPVYNQSQYTTQQCSPPVPQFFPQQQLPPIPPQYQFQQIPSYPQQYPGQHLTAPYSNQQVIPGQQQSYHQQPIQLQQQQPQYHQQLIPVVQQQPQYSQPLTSVVQQQEQQVQPPSYHPQVGPTIQQYPQHPIPDQQQLQQQPPQCLPSNPKHSSVYTTHDKPSDDFKSEDGGGSDTNTNENGSTIIQNQSADIEFSASVKEYLESDRRTYFNFTFDGDSGSSRSASTIPDSLTSSANQVAQELDPAGAIWELENTDDEVSFRVEEAVSGSSSLTASVEEKNLMQKLENDSNNTDSNNTDSKSSPPLNIIEQEPTEKLLIQRLEKELQENIAKKENYYKSLARQSSKESKDSADGQSTETKLADLEDIGSFNSILDSGYQPDTLKELYQSQSQPLDNYGLTESVDELTNAKALPAMTDSGIIIREELEMGYNEGITSGPEFSLDHLTSNDQLAADLQNGHKERPISLISTTSVDTGYVPDTDSEVGTVMNSPLEKINKTITSDEIEEASIQPHDKTELKNENKPDLPESDTPKPVGTKIESDNKDVEKQEDEDVSGDSLKKDRVDNDGGGDGDNKISDLSRLDRDSSSNEKDIEENQPVEAPKDGLATKSKKNATNKEKADTAAGHKANKEKNKNFLSETKSKQEKIAPKVIKRIAPKSKWDNIMNKIETNKENVKRKPKIEVKSKLETYLVQKPIITTKPKEVSSKKVTHIPQPDYSKVKSKLFSATASSATKQRPVTHSKKSENVLKEMPEGTGSSTVSINSVISNKSNQSAMGTSTNNAAGRTKQALTKIDKGKSRSQVEQVKIERPVSAASSRTDATQNSLKSMTTRNVGKLQQSDKTVKSSNTLDQSKDQNKLNTKTSKSKISGLKSGTSTDKTTTSKEITRLEALCEIRTKDLNYTRLQVKSSLAAFDAMAVIVNYLANDLDAFACPTLGIKLAKVQEELSQAEDQIEKLKRQQTKLEQDIKDCNKQHEKALTDLVNAQSASLLSQKESLMQENTENIKRLKEDQVRELERMTMMLAEKKSDMTHEHKNNMDNLRLTHLEEIRSLQRKHENQMEDLHRQHRDKLEEITHTFESIKMTLSEKVESLRCECEEFRTRARICEEALEQEANVRVETALSPYRDLPREIESLKTVLEMRNHEIHELRSHKIDLEKQLEELPPALEKITLLQQKIENLEAILQIKSDHEKQLNEKCQGLMRKFNKETKANKRLSMEFDELKWRMSQSELSGSQENILKMYSCSPSGSESGSPDPTRRFSRSPKHWDHKDGGGDQLSSSITGDGSMESKVKRRSGTFLVHDRPSPLSSPKSKSASGTPAILMSQSWAGTGESTTVTSPKQSKPMLSPPGQSLGLLEQPPPSLEASTLSVGELALSTEPVSPQENAALEENK